MIYWLVYKTFAGKAYGEPITGVWADSHAEAWRIFCKEYQPSNGANLVLVRG